MPQRALSGRVVNGAMTTLHRHLTDPVTFDPAIRKRPTVSMYALRSIALDLAQQAGLDAVPIEGGASRCYLQLACSPQCDAWLIAWSRSAEVDLHDHGGSIGFVQVVAGTLREVYSDARRARPLRSRLLAAGMSVPIPASRVHAVANPCAETALSVHVYSPPLGAMTFFEPGPGDVLAPVRREHDDEWQPPPAPRTTRPAA